MYGGIAALKTATASHFVIKQLFERPHLTGLLGANSYDQLSQVLLRELFKWLEEYQIEYVIDKMPPAHWGCGRKFKTYQNILSIKNPITGQVAIWFTRVLSDPDALRGLTLSMFVLDEIRDTTRYTFDVILSRLRESNYIKGLLTTTTNGHSWDYDLFVKKADYKMYGAFHIKTIESVKAGIITKEFYDSLRASYSPLMAAQELDCEHLNIHAGRAYYSAGNANKMRTSPWGAEYPDPDYPLIVGMDFNFSPSPCVWTVSQISPDGDRMHVFGEISGLEMSTPQMTQTLISQYPGFFYKIFGDASGNRGTTSNAGEHDYNQVASVLQDAGLPYSIDVDQSNPRVRDRVECLNALLKNAMGEIRLTYDPGRCPLLDLDMNIVGWKKTVISWQGKLDSGGNPNATHSSDSLGYAVFKLFPPGRRGSFVPNNESLVSRNLSHVF
jgi:hypothetical protein